MQSMLLDARIKGKTFKVRVTSKDDFKTFDSYDLFDEHMNLICNRDELEAAIKRKNETSLYEDIALYLEMKHGFKKVNEAGRANQWYSPTEGYSIGIESQGIKQCHFSIWYPYPTVRIMLSSHNDHVFANLDSIIDKLKGLKASGKTLQEYVKGDLPWHNFTQEDKIDLALIAANELLSMAKEPFQDWKPEKIVEQITTVINYLKRPENKTIILMEGK